MKSYAVFYNNGVTDGLPTPRGKDEIQENTRVMQERLESNWQQLEAAQALEGLIVHSRQEAIGTLCVSGSEEKIQQLRTLLEERNIGTLTENVVAFRGASGETSDPVEAQP